jgi:hypothetical protein
LPYSVVEKDIKTKIKILDKEFGVKGYEGYIKFDKASGEVKLKYTQDHHILHQALENDPDIKSLFQKASFDIDDQVNRMLLPTKKGAEIYQKSKHTIHEGRHVRPFDLIYKLEKLNRNSTNYTKEKLYTEIVRIINEERELLNKGLKQLNKNARDKL